MEQTDKKWRNVSKDPGLGGPLGGLCNILFPKKYNERYMYHGFSHGVGYQRNPSYKYFCDCVHACSKRTYFHLSLKYISY